MGRKYYLDPVTKEKIYIKTTVSKPPVIDVQVDGESVLEDRIAKINLSDKQDVITDLDAIRVGAEKGATALQSIPSEYITETELANKGYLTSESDPIYTADKPNIALKSEIPTKVSELTNDSGFKTKDTTYSLSKSGSTITLTSSDGTKTTVEDSDTTYSNATTTTAGLMSAADKSKLDGLIACTDAEIDAIFA